MNRYIFQSVNNHYAFRNFPSLMMGRDSNSIMSANWGRKHDYRSPDRKSIQSSDQHSECFSRWPSRHLRLTEMMSELLAHGCTSPRGELDDSSTESMNLAWPGLGRRWIIEEEEEAERKGFKRYKLKIDAIKYWRQDLESKIMDFEGYSKSSFHFKCLPNSSVWASIGSDGGPAPFLLYAWTITMYRVNFLSSWIVQISSPSSVAFDSTVLYANSSWDRCKR